MSIWLLGCSKVHLAFTGLPCIPDKLQRESGKEDVMVKGSWMTILAGGLGMLLSAQADCWLEAAQQTHIDVRLLQAIAWVESKNHPEVLHRNHDGSLDVGLMQINSRWWPQLAAPVDLLEPCYNIRVGAWILRQAVHQVGPVWAAVGRYHGGNAMEQARYQQKVYVKWQELVARH